MRRVCFSAMSAILMSGLFASMAAAQTADVDWPQWRGPNRDGKSSDTGLLKSWPEGGPKLLWQAKSIGQGFSSVSFGGGMIYITGRKDVDDPTELPDEEDILKRPGNRFYISAFDMDGNLKWRKDVAKAYMGSFKGTRGTVTYDKGNLYVETGDGLLGCYDSKNGDLKWSRKAAEFEGEIAGFGERKASVFEDKAGGFGWGYCESTLIIDDMAILSPGGTSFMVALNKDTGKTIWKSEPFGPAQYVSPIHVVHEGIPMIITGTHQGLFAVHAKTGKTLWSQEFAKSNMASIPTPAFSDGYVFWAVGYGKGGICMKLNVDGEKVVAEEAWRTKDMVCHHGGYVILDGYIYGNNNNGYACIELESGETKWEEKGVGKGSLVWADGMLFLFGEKKGLVGLASCSPEGMEMKGTFNVDGFGPSWAHPVVIGGRLYIRYDDNLYCFDVSAGN